MPAEDVEKWLESRRPAQVNGQRLRPLEHTQFRGMPLSIQRGQAEAFCLIGKDKRQWILKKFLPGKIPDRKYLESISSLLPKDDGFISGTDRQVLTTRTLSKNNGSYYTTGLARWLDGTVLMRRIPGVDWGTLADEIRDGHLALEQSHRVTLCRKLTELVDTMEQYGITHRDLSSGNVFIDTKTWSVALIDFDSLFHNRLSMPETTTCGTVGYTPPFAWRGGILNAATTWCLYADRFALAILNAEFLVLDKGAPLTAEGGMFDQNELSSRSGKGLNAVFQSLKAKFPTALTLFRTAVESYQPQECPSPQDWLQFCESTGAIINPPRLEELENIPSQYFESLLRKKRPAAPLWPAPRLVELPTISMYLPKQKVHAVQLPPNPWS